MTGGSFSCALSIQSATELLSRLVNRTNHRIKDNTHNKPSNDTTLEGIISHRYEYIMRLFTQSYGYVRCVCDHPSIVVVAFSNEIAYVVMASLLLSLGCTWMLCWWMVAISNTCSDFEKRGNFKVKSIPKKISRTRVI